MRGEHRLGEPWWVTVRTVFLELGAGPAAARAAVGRHVRAGDVEAGSSGQGLAACASPVG